ncbi:DegV family protein [Clostridium sp. 'deep sea']|uniref:DegV family protein n=1 Tax=Clostridium sp. 'deep sea' TaxID=2779445 RepID=UPI001896626D|nr:DegV family protein [Clostridium sp. 'deep sea']QOR36777.1 DegV family protein [Clostridium sp. 'deep sea']
MSKIAIVTDSTAVIEKNLLNKHNNLYTIPLQIIIGNNTYNDGIDLTQEEFFSLMHETEQLPTTSQPLVGELTKLFEDILIDYDHIIYITISSGISGTYQTGELVRSMVAKDKITIFDTLSTSVVQRQMVIEALCLAKKAKDVKDIIKHLEFIRDNSEILLVVGDLKHLHRTGRISLAAASIGTVLKIKPLLHFIDGKIVVKQKVRTIKKSHAKIIEILKSEQLCENSVIMLAHASAEDYVKKLQDEIKLIYPTHEIIVSELSPVISVHTGPRTVGLAWVKKNSI